MDGKPYTLGDREFVVPRMRVAGYERTLEALDAIDRARASAATEDPAGLKRLGAMVDAMLGLLRPNYPDLTAAELKECVSVADIDNELAGLMRAAGTRKADVGEAVSP